MFSSTESIDEHSLRAAIVSVLGVKFTCSEYVLAYAFLYQIHALL